MSKPSLKSRAVSDSLRLVEALIVTVIAALRQQACDQDEEFAAVLEHAVRELEALRPPMAEAAKGAHSCCRARENGLRC